MCHKMTVLQHIISSHSKHTPIFLDQKMICTQVRKRIHKCCWFQVSHFLLHLTNIANPLYRELRLSSLSKKRNIKFCCLYLTIWFNMAVTVAASYLNIYIYIKCTINITIKFIHCDYACVR
jgi:hypothetical protein